ncbi:MAG: hypothetical protein A2Y17_02830 [Clostridiales bacterium GWF2_38_85]|nr:MAG: hypothetical protein A2Y17_02830 [Clostridiales bacterium GWF2_38_85]
MSKLSIFIKENFRIIRKFWINQFTMSLFGLFLTIPMSVFAKKNSLGNTPVLIASIVAAFLFIFIMHDLFWQAGAKNAIKQKGKGSRIDRKHGLKTALVAYSPTIIITLISVIMFLINVNSSSEWAGNVNSVLIFILNFIFSGMYFGIFNLYFSNQPYYMLIFTAITIIIPAISYYMGTKETKLHSLVGLGNVDFKTKTK